MRLAHRELGGAGPDLVLLHGLFGSAANWGGIARRLASGYRCVGLDLRNHGASPHDPAMAYPALADDVLETTSALGMDAFFLLGHSLGGKVAMMAAARAPERVRALAVIDIAPVRYRQLVSLPVLEALRALDPGDLASRAEADAALAPRLPDLRLRQFLLQNLVRGPAGYRWRLDLEALGGAADTLADFPLAPGAGDDGSGDPGAVYSGPVLVVRGGRSDHVRDAHLPAFRRLFPRVSVRTFDDSGHWLHAEQPDALATALRDFLGRAGSPGQGL